VGKVLANMLFLLPKFPINAKRIPHAPRKRPKFPKNAKIAQHNACIPSKMPGVPGICQDVVFACYAKSHAGILGLTLQVGAF